MAPEAAPSRGRHGVPMRPFSRPRGALLVFAVLLSSAAAAAEVRIDAPDAWPAVQAALQSAREHFRRQPGEDFAIRFAAGSFTLAHPGAKAAFDLSGIVPANATGHLVIEGQGMERTNLVIAVALHALYGQDVNHLVVRDLQFSRPGRAVTQGRVVDVGPDALTLKLDPGMPVPPALVDDLKIGHWLRKCVVSGADASFPEEDNDQVAWTDVERLTDATWRFKVLQVGRLRQFRPGDLVAVKSKHGGQAYWFFKGQDVRFERLRWLDQSRGVFRGGMSKIAILDSRIQRRPEPDGSVQCLSTSDGGPQIGQPDDPPTSDVLVKGNVFVGTGDDAIALFNASGVVAGNQVIDSLGRGILLVHSPAVEVKDNVLVRSRLLKQDTR